MIEVESKRFCRALRLVSELTRYSVVPVLGQARVHANGALSIACTDLDVGCEVRIPYEGQPAAPFMLPSPARLGKSLAHAGAGSVRIMPGDAGDRAMRIEAGPLSMDAQGRPVEDFPDQELRQFAQVEFECVFGAAEIAAIARVALAMATEETRYYLNGIHFHMIDAWTLRAVATDGHRMFWADIKIPGAEIVPDGVFARRGIIVPRDIINRIVTKFAKCDEVAFTIGRQVANAPAQAEGTAPTPQGMPRVAFAGKVGEMAVTYSGKTIDGTFPDYRRVIPTAASWHMTVPVAAMRRAAHACVAAGSGRAPGVTLARRADTLECSVSADWAVRSTDRERVRIAVPITASAGLPDNSEVGVNGNYLLACLANCTGETVTMGSEWTGERDPSFCPIRMSDDGNADFGMVLMPMRI